MLGDGRQGGLRQVDTSSVSRLARVWRYRHQELTFARFPSTPHHTSPETTGHPSVSHGALPAQRPSACLPTQWPGAGVPRRRAVTWHWPANTSETCCAEPLCLLTVEPLHHPSTNPRLLIGGGVGNVKAAPGSLPPQRDRGRLSMTQLKDRPKAKGPTFAETAAGRLRANLACCSPTRPPRNGPLPCPQTP